MYRKESTGGMSDFLKAVIKSNREIVDIISSNKHTYLCEEVSLGAGGDMSRRIDLMAEDIFIKNLKRFGNIYSEECGFVKGDTELDIVIDPIDGSENFVSNFPYYGTSVALKDGDKCIAAVIVNLANGDLFYKDTTRFQRANMKSLNFKDVENNSVSRVGIFERSYRSIDFAKRLGLKGIKFRSPGAFALSLAYAHDTNFVLYEGDMRIYDVEAGLYMCEDIDKIIIDKMLIISKDKEIFDRISQLFKRENEIL